MNKTNYLHTDPKTSETCMVQGDKYRISVLTGKLIRFEYDENGMFEDSATQTVINRNFEAVQFRVTNNVDQVEVVTEYLHIIYDKQKFSRNGLNIRLNRNTYTNNSIWHYGDQGDNLKGTARTLDTADGAIPLGDGVLSRSGYSVIDDSKSLILDDAGWIHPPRMEHTDFYFFGYGHNYLECLNDFYQLCGKTPLLPRFALGNWWSRFYPYTQTEYIELMNRFAEEKLPFSVAVIDMDWHHVKLDEKYGNGWTGYSWNKDLFPDHKKMLQELHERGMKVTLNVHPADGIRGHEDAYISMAKALGVDYENEVPISFDVAEPEFLSAYFKFLHHPLEEEGVDFWWIDWQQGNTTKIPGLDPLWMLNHYHYLDNKREGKRPFIFSRYAGIGSHRYPIGFSGDSIITWESLAFQPYFTATASNIGYGWWSHDIGGHMDGYRDDELAARWIQYGVFSPIMRLHSSSNTFTGKEPWKYCDESRKVINRFLRLRHKLIPYLYTMNEKAYSENQPLIQPMYYQYPDCNEAYEVPNQYFFGSELIVHPITAKMDTRLKAGKVKTWLPEGLWFDLFSGMRYKGNRNVIMYRGLDTIPVLAKAGAIIPIQKEATIDSHTDNPTSIELCVFAGNDGEFVMYEDDGISMEYENRIFAKTRYTLQWKDCKRFTIHPVEGECSLVPKERYYLIKLFGLPKDSIESIRVNGNLVTCSQSYDGEKNIAVIELQEVDVKDKIEVFIKNAIDIADNQIQWRMYEALNKAQIDYQMKEKIYDMVKRSDSVEGILSNLDALNVFEELKELVREIVLCR